MGNFKIWESGDSFPESYFFVSEKQPALGEGLLHVTFLKDKVASHLNSKSAFFAILLTMESVLFEKINDGMYGSKINITHVSTHLLARNLNSLLLFFLPTPSLIPSLHLSIPSVTFPSDVCSGHREKNDKAVILCSFLESSKHNLVL